jgi:hypothetical protein
LNDDNGTVQFRAQEVVEAVKFKQQWIETRNMDEKDKLQGVTSGDGKATIFSMYQRGEIEETVARVFLGDHLDMMAADAEEVRAAIDDDTKDLVQ